MRLSINLNKPGCLAMSKLFPTLMTAILISVASLLSNAEAAKANTKEDALFYSHLFMYCSLIEVPRNEKEFLKKMIIPMAEKSFGSSPDRYWTEAGCEPRYIPETLSPIPHIIAENTTDRMQFMHSLKKIYVAKNDLATFTKIINSKNTQGQTVLDYMHYVWSTNRYIEEEEPALNEFAKYLCDNGAVYSIFKNKKCPAEYMKIVRPLK